METTANALWPSLFGAGRQPQAWSRDRARVPRLSRLQRRSGGAWLPLQLLGGAPLHRLESGLRDTDAACLPGNEDQPFEAWNRGDGVAMAQPRAPGGADGDARPDFRRPARFRHRQGLT